MFLKLFLLLAAIAWLSFQTRADDIAFIKLGSYSEWKTQTKFYYIPRYFKSNWVHTRSICQAYGMDVLSLRTEHEANHFLGICQRNADLFESFTHIGGLTLSGKSVSTWYWVDSGKLIDYKLKFGPGQPDNWGSNEFCLSIGKYPSGLFFNDFICNGYEAKFICQKIESLDCKAHSECFARLAL